MSKKSLDSVFPLARRSFLRLMAGTAAGTAAMGGLPLLSGCLDSPEEVVPRPDIPPGNIPEILLGEDVFSYMERVNGHYDHTLYQQIIGAANPYKEGDDLIGVAAAADVSRANAADLLAATRLYAIDLHPLYSDPLYDLVVGRVDSEQQATTATWTMAELKDHLLGESEENIKAISGGLSSDVIGCVVKLMSNEELIQVGAKVFNPLPGSQIGAEGYMGARVQPNSPTDNIDDIQWQVFNAWSYAVGDVLLGTNPVSSELPSIHAVELALKDIINAFNLEDVLPWCVLGHIDLQAQVESENPGSTALWFQSLGGTESANGTFDVSIQGMLNYAAARTGKYGLYFETGQGADATNGHDAGFDMVIHESRKYGFARALKQDVAAAQAGAGQPVAPWVHLNDVAGFIGPEVFRTREQLVRCCLEDTVMGKLHGLTIGLDICSTLHMEVSLDDLDWCISEIMPANPAYLMGLPTKNDPMLSYLTTGYQDHVRIRNDFGYKVNDAMWDFFQTLDVIDANGDPSTNFGQPAQVYLAYRRALDPMVDEATVLAEAQVKLDEIRARGVFIAEGYGDNPWDLDPALQQQIDDLYADAKVSLFSEWSQDFVDSIPANIWLATQSLDRDDYILHPQTGEVLSADAMTAIEELRASHAGAYDVQIVISDGLNARSLMDDGHLLPFLTELRTELAANGYSVAPDNVVLTTGRVRAGYQLGELLFGEDASAHRGIIHIIGERPGTGHRNFSAYITGPQASIWGNYGQVDHDISRVVSGISDSALDPALAAIDTRQLLDELWNINFREGAPKLARTRPIKRTSRAAAPAIDTPAT